MLIQYTSTGGLTLMRLAGLLISLLAWGLLPWFTCWVIGKSDSWPRYRIGLLILSVIALPTRFFLLMLYGFLQRPSELLSLFSDIGGLIFVGVIALVTLSGWGVILTLGLARLKKHAAA